MQFNLLSQSCYVIKLLLPSCSLRFVLVESSVIRLHEVVRDMLLELLHVIVRVIPIPSYGVQCTVRGVSMSNDRLHCVFLILFRFVVCRGIDVGCTIDWGDSYDESVLVDTE